MFRKGKSLWKSSCKEMSRLRLFDTDGVRVPGTECDFQFSRSGNRPTHGRFYSPRYPSIYPNNVRCSYYFHARPKERVKILFEEVSLQKGDVRQRQYPKTVIKLLKYAIIKSFIENIEYDDGSATYKLVPLCDLTFVRFKICLRRADIIKVFDGRDTNAPTISMLCNELSGYEVLSTGPALLIQFTANSATPGQGFSADFLFQPPPDSTAADSDRLLKLSFGKAFESLGPEVSATTMLEERKEVINKLVGNKFKWDQVETNKYLFEVSLHFLHLVLAALAGKHHFY
ncbi:unnamed protein product [Arctia plantaginis]|uniref:CUB domain-containing protein n=1 Tax=Arctia plantaginis TaxID=874455 RepID=A0A8S0Z7W2_ARCPL|nr:unnamed protein product [Arctia plantaginis]